MTDPLSHTLQGRCPRCGEGALFAGLIAFAERCDRCDLDYGRFNVGDGPAAFLTLGIGALVVALAIWLELSFAPPFWVHVVLWLPLTVAAVVVGLRLAKAWLLASEFRQRAGEARRKDLK